MQDERLDFRDLAQSPVRERVRRRLEPLGFPCVAGMEALLTGWGCSVRAFESHAAAAAGSGPDWTPSIVLADLRLRGGENGIDTMNHLRARHDPPPGVIITGDNAAEEVKTVNDSGYHVLYKPVALAKLRALMQGLLSPKSD